MGARSKSQRPRARGRRGLPHRRVTWPAAAPPVGCGERRRLAVQFAYVPWLGVAVAGLVRARCTATGHYVGGGSGGCNGGRPRSKFGI
jgi:hypothetical protein